MTEDEREKRCDDISREAADWIVSKIDGIRAVGYRGTTDLENEIYGWLMTHAVFYGNSIDDRPKA